MEFSVLISVYQKENAIYFEESLNSIVEQTLMPSEIVIIKDGPLTSALDSVINDYEMKYPKLVKIKALPENVGLGRALAIGIEYCEYDLIARMDSDDIARNDRFELQMKEFYIDKSLDIVGSQIAEFENNIDNIIAKRILPLTNEEIVKYSKKRNPYNHVTVMFKKKSVLNAGNYQETHGIGFEDYQLWVNMILNGSKGKNIDDFLVYVRTGLDMFGRRGGTKYFVNAVRFRIKIFKSGFAGIKDTLVSILANSIVCFSPKWFRKMVYLKLLRK